MPGNGDLIRSMRAGGSTATAAAHELSRRARAGSVSHEELAQVKEVLSGNPALGDAFRAGDEGSPARLAPGAEQVFRDVDSLSPDHGRLTDARALPRRFQGDLKLLERQLLGHPGLTRRQKAERLYAFFEGYAQRFAQLAQGVAQANQAAADPGLAGEGARPALAPPLAPAELAHALAQFERSLREAGFGDLRAADGASGLEHALRLLEHDAAGPLPARPEGLDAPTWKDNPPADARAARGEAGRRGDLGPGAAAPLAQPRSDGARGDDEAPARAPRRRQPGTDQVLGGRMLWNVLHLLRGDELDEVARRDALNALVVTALLLLTLGAVLVVALAWA